MIVIDEVPPSADLRAQLADEGRPILLAFSGGKDALAAWLALRDDGIPVVPYYLYYVPDLRFVTQTLDRFEQTFGQRIARYPHPSLYRWLNALIFQAPEFCSLIERAQLPKVTYEEVVSYIKEDHDLPPETWVADGVRAADSPVRRVSIKKHGALKPRTRKASVVWDWQKKEVLDAIAAADIALPVDYDWFGRSFDGLDYRFLEPISRNAPDDYQRILEWFPLANLELVRHGL